MPPAEHTMTTWDGAELFYRAWLPAKPTDRALLLFHRGHEHSARWNDVVEMLRLDDIAIFAWDARGHGRSPGERGSAPNLAAVVKDADCFVRHVAERHGTPVENMVVMAHSVGAVVVAAWVHDYAPPIRGMVLGAPAFRVKLYLPFAVPLLRLKQKLFGPSYVKSYVKARMLTHAAAEAQAYQADPLIFRQIAVNILLDLHDTSTRLLADAGAILTPTLLLGAGADWVVRLSAQQQFFERLSSPVKQMHVFPGLYHAIFHERERAEVVARARAFILERFQPAPAQPSLGEADRAGYTKAEFDRLSAPGGRRFAPARWAMKSIARLSKGIQLGWRSGFDSGVMLDYVYANQPQGITPLGRWIDRVYLQSIGWRGIRQRRVHLEATLRRAIEQTHAAGRPVQLLDIAAGAGRYVCQTLRALPHLPIRALLRDYKPENLEAARRLAQDYGLKNVTIVNGDAFDRAALGGIRPRPTIAIVSGLYELFPANEPVRQSLGGLADAMEPGSLLLYTGQPWHPQLEFIARVLPNREGRPWIMRRRTQAELDELVRTAGFEKLAMEIDPWGMFTVSIARRVKS